MSYCRFSSMNNMCDVYVYADCYGGYTTHVASNRLLFSPIPAPPLSLIISRGEWDIKLRRLTYKNKIDMILANITTYLWMALSKPHLWSLQIIPHVKIGLEHDGEQFNDETANECADRLLQLRYLGYKVPQSAINALRNERD